MGRMRMSGGSPVRMLRGDAVEALDKAHHARARAAAGGAAGMTVFEVNFFRRLRSSGRTFSKNSTCSPCAGEIYT